MPNGAYLRELTLLPGEETAELLMLDVFPEFDYSGRLSYRKTTTGLYLLNGPFEVVGKEVPNEDGFTRNISVTYLGNFADGKLDGKIQRLYQGYESESQATINFVNGRCTTGELHEEGEGMVNDYREPEMNTCTFGYLDEGLRQQFQ